MRYVLTVVLKLTFLGLINTVASSNTTSLQKRDLLTVDTSCYEPNPYNQHQTYWQKVETSLTDAFSLIRLAISHDDFYRSQAFSHYFPPEDVERVKRMLQSLFWALHDSKIAGPIRVDCGSQKARACFEKNARSIIVASRQPEGGLTFCDRFFDGTVLESARGLRDRPYDESPRSWCHNYLSIGNLIGAGGSIVQQMSKLYTVGEAAQIHSFLFQADGAMYGTDSIKRVEMVANPEGGGGPYKRVPKWKAARLLKEQWDDYLSRYQGAQEPMIPASQNDASYASAVVEWWFSYHCNVAEIKPTTI